MVFGLIAAAAGIGLSLAGLGVYKGSSNVGEAAQRLSRGATDDLHKLRVFVTEVAWPEVNGTLVRIQEVLDSAEIFFKISMIVVALLCITVTAYVTRLLHTHVTSKTRKKVSLWLSKRKP